MRDIPKPNYKEVKSVDINWKNFAKGLNTLVNPTKIREDELSIATNIILVDEGSPQRRWGTDYYTNNSSGTGTYGLFPFYKSDGTKQLTKIENGFFKKAETNGNWTQINGASFATAQLVSGVMAFDTLYLSNGTNPLTKYDGSSLTVFSEINAPDSNWVTRGASLNSGEHLYSYRVTALNAVGETMAVAATTIAVNRKRSEWNTSSTNIKEGFSTKVSWNKVTGATGYNIYGYLHGDETYLDHVDGIDVTSYTDYGLNEPSAVFVLPEGNGTGGPKGKYILEYKSSLLISGDPSNPSRVYYSAGVDKPDSFLISDGGGYIDISKNSDDGEITGIGKYQNKAVVFKERSIWQLDFAESVIPALSNIVKDIGCVSHFTIQNVENDLYFLGRKIGGGAAIYILGNEPNYLNVLRTNELSSRVRPELLALGASNLRKANAVYYDGKYILFFADGGVTINNSALIYDRERLGFTRWDNIFSNYVTVYYDSDNEEHLLFADGSDYRVTKLDPSYTTDKGSAIEWVYRTREEDFGDAFRYKRFKWINMRFRNVSGTISVDAMTNGSEILRSYSIRTSANNLDTAFRNLRFRVGRFRKTVDENSSTPETTITRRVPIGRLGVNSIKKTLALRFSGSGVADRATLLDVHIEGRPKSKNYYPRSEVIT